MLVQALCIYSIRAGWFWDSHIAEIYCRRMPCEFHNRTSDPNVKKEVLDFGGFARVDN